MNRDDAISLLRTGATGVKVWNEWRQDRRAKKSILPDLSECDLSGCDMREIDLSGIRLEHANIQAADLRNADLTRARLSHSSFREANLRGASLIEANLHRADLSYARLLAIRSRAASFRSAKLIAANLSKADLLYSDLTFTDLSSSRLVGADLTDVNLTRSVVDGTDFSNAICWNTQFVRIDLSKAKSLSSIRHHGSSTIDVEALYYGRGIIPDDFLRGCGVPENLIHLLPGLVASASSAQFYSCFISYSHKDEEFVKRLYSRMRAKGLRVWYAPEEMKLGRKIHEQIDLAIEKHDKLLLVLSERSMKSRWVGTEIYHARQREEREGRQVLFPIRLCSFETIRDWRSFDGDTGKDMAREVREYFIPDFSNWKDEDSFEKGFDRLMRDLKADED